MLRPGVPRRFRLALRRRDRLRHEVREEIEHHLDELTDALVARGAPRAVARAEALRRIGPIDDAFHRLYDTARRRDHRMQLREGIEAARDDVRYTLRQLRRAPGFAAAVVATFALGIGANATMFGIIDRLLFRPPDALVAPGRVHRLYLQRTVEGRERSLGNIQYRRYLDIAAAATTLDAAGAYWAIDLPVGLGAEAHERKVATMSASMWQFFDARPVLGRVFTPAEDAAPLGTKVAVISYGYWRSRYGGSPAVLDSTMHIGASRYAIIGVAPRGFSAMSLEAPAAFIPITAAAADIFGGFGPRIDYHTTYNMSWMEMFVRRKPSATLEAATTDLTNAYRRSYQAQVALQPRAIPLATAKPRALAAPVQQQRGPNATADTKVAVWLVGVAAIVLLIACANVGNLLLARALRRRREIAVRVALGVSRARLLGQLLVESVILAAIGGVAGLAVAWWGGDVLRATLLPSVDWGTTITDPRVLLFSAATAVLAGVLSGIAPALQARRSDVASALKAGAREGTFRRSRLRTALLVLQPALSVVLLVGAGLFVRSLRNVNSLRLGYDADHLLWVSAEMRGTVLDPARTNALAEEVLAAARATPGVAAAARAATVPFYMGWSQDIFVPGIDSVSGLGEFSSQAASPGYFETMGTRLVRGRGITDADRAGAPLVMVVSHSMARRLWSGQEALGKCVKVVADTMPCHTVVGIAEDIKRESLRDDSGLHYYVSIAQGAPPQTGMFVRTHRPAEAAAPEVRRQLQRLMPGSAYLSAKPMATYLAPQMRPWTLGATMFAVFGGLALLVAAVGLYSVIAYGVAQRAHEMGVRMALGARGGDVVRLVVREGLGVTVIGVAAGTAIALVAGRWIAPLLFGVSPADPLVLGGVAGVLVAVAVAASGVPARRASRVDPAVALRGE